jgi:malonyl-CoA/methylmalonyl-CoA synthetase
MAACEHAPDKPLLLFEGRQYSYAQLYDAALGWASGLRARGLRPGERVALFLENSPAFLAAYLGTQLAGAIIVLVNTQYRQTELRHILGDAGVRLCVTDMERRAELDRVRDKLRGLEEIVQIGASDLDNDPLQAQTRHQSSSFQLPAANDVALIAYTSGTTGRSKGAMLTHGNLTANSAAVTTAWRWTAEDRLLLTLPLFHIHGLGVGVHGTLLAGGMIDLRRRFEAQAVYDTLLEGNTSMFFGVPTMYTRLIAEALKRREAGARDMAALAAVRLFVSGSAPLSAQTFEQFERLFGQPILERYGMTETVMNLTNPYAGERRPGTVGKPFPGQQARIVDVRTRQPIDDERQGEIQVRGPHVFKGYWQRPDATAEAFDADWFNTGDLGWRSADGYYTISGRARELIITGGYNVYPREVEEVLQAHPAIAEAAVLGLPHADLGEQVVAVVVLRRQAAGDRRQESGAEQLPPVGELIALCREQLAAYKKPQQVFVVEELPRNALGKVQKHVLRERLEGA